MRPFSVSFSSKHVKLITKKFVVQIVKTECEKRSKHVVASIELQTCMNESL